MKGNLLIFSAPSGSGKTTIVKHLLRVFPQLQFSISACTREKRPGEEHGKDYYFLSRDEFRKKTENNEFVEWEEVYHNQYYGTLKTELERIWNSGRHVVFDVDVAGGVTLKRQFPANSLAVFIRTKSMDELEKRLKARDADSEESIQKRLDKAKAEMLYANKFDVVLVNDQLDKALKKAEELVKGFLEGSQEYHSTINSTT